DYDGAGSHMLLLADDGLYAFVAEIAERFVWIFQAPFTLGRFRWRHRRRKIDQPLRIRREPAHHFERRRGVLFANGDGAMEARRDDSLAVHVFHVEQVIVLMLRR